MRIWMILVVIVLLAIPFVLKADIVQKILFSNKAYAKQIEVKTYILTQQQVAGLFGNPEKDPVQFDVMELDKYTREPRYFVIRVKNLGKEHAWGLLSCKVRCIHKPLKIPVISINEFFCDYVICISGTVVAPADNSIYPDISYEWDELYTK